MRAFHQPAGMDLIWLTPSYNKYTPDGNFGATDLGIPTGASLQQWRDLLGDRTPDYAAQPWQQLAAVHRAAGHEGDARRILIAQQDDRRRQGRVTVGNARSDLR